MMNAEVSMKNQIIGVLAKMIKYGIPVRIIAILIKHVKLINS